MFRSVFTSATVKKYYRVGVVVVLLVVAGIGVIWALPQNAPALSRIEDAAQGQPMTNPNVEPVDADAYKAHLYELDRFARAAETTQTERAAPPDVYKAHLYELDRFTRAAEAIQTERAAPPDVYKAHLYELDRFGQAAEAAKP